MFWHLLKKIIANDDEMVEGMVVPVGDRELILAPYLRVGDDVSHEEKLKKSLKRKFTNLGNDRRPRQLMETPYCWAGKIF